MEWRHIGTENMLRLPRLLSSLPSGAWGLSGGYFTPQSCLYSSGSDTDRSSSSEGASTSSASPNTTKSQQGAPTDLSPAARRMVDIFSQSAPAVGSDAAAAVPQAQQSADRDQAVVPEYHLPEKNAISLVLQAVENCKPLMKVMTQKAGTRQVHIPKVVLPAEQRSLAIRWILQAAHKRQEAQPAGKRVPMAECLAIELLLASRKKGSAREKRDALHALAIENKANLLRAS